MKQRTSRSTNGWKLAAPAAMAILAAAMLVGGPGLASAYLTDTESTSNTTTIGRIRVDLEEPHWPGNDSPEVTDIVPNEEIPKDPVMENTGDNDAVFFASYSIPVENLILAADDGTRQPRANAELFLTSADALDTTGRIADSASFAAGTYNTADWELLKTEYLDAGGEVLPEAGLTSEGVKTVRRLFGYKSRVARDSVTSPLFTAIKLANVIEGQIEDSSRSVQIDSFAIQADYIADIDTSGEGALDRAVLSGIYEVYFNQSAAVDPKDADTSNEKDLGGAAL